MITIIPEILVKDSEKAQDYVKIFSDKIVDLARQRILSDMASMKKTTATLYLYIGINEDMTERFFSKIIDKFYLGADESLRVSLETENIVTVLKNAVVKNIDFPAEINTCHIFLSISPINKSILLKASDTKRESDMIFQAEEPLFSLDEVVMSQDERDAVMRAISLVKEKQLIYEKWNFKKVDKHTKSVICFHGVSGTGKTMAAHAVAKFLGKKILIGSYAQIESEYVGVGAKNLKSFFKCAQEQDAVLFIDEADTFLSKRLPSSNDSSKHYNSMSNELYQLVESFDGCIIFASNHIKDFDPAIISRIIEPIEFRLPDADARKIIINKLLQKELPIDGGKTEELLNKLSEISKGFSGRDIRKALQVCHAEAAYQFKTIEHRSDDDISIPISMVIECFEKVSKAKCDMDKAMGKKTSADLISSFTEGRKRNVRYIQMAAHTLLIDGEVKPKERALFTELSSIMQVNIPLTSDCLPSVEEICAEASSREERAQIFDVVSRMAACDESVPDVEMKFVLHIAHLLGIGDAYDRNVEEYTKSLADSYCHLSSINSLFGKTDVDVLAELKKEYTEGAAYYHLGEMYQSGSNFMGGIVPNKDLADKYFGLAAKSGYAEG